MIHCEKGPVGYRVEIDGTVHDLAKESLRVIRGVYDALANNNKQQAEKYKKLVISAALGQDWFCIFDTTSNSVCRFECTPWAQPERRGILMAEAKKCPVDRKKLLKGLASCAILGCKDCPYKSDCAQQGIDAIAYIAHLEHVLEEAGL